MNATRSGATPSPHWGEGRGEGGGSRLWESPHRTPLRSGEREIKRLESFKKPKSKRSCVPTLAPCGGRCARAARTDKGCPRQSWRFRADPGPRAAGRVLQALLTRALGAPLSGGGEGSSRVSPHHDQARSVPTLQHLPMKLHHAHCTTRSGVIVREGVACHAGGGPVTTGSCGCRMPRLRGA